MNIFVIILSHEHGEDVVARSNELNAYKAAGELMLSTIADLESEIDKEWSSSESVSKLTELKGLLEEGFTSEQFLGVLLGTRILQSLHKAVDLYNELYESFFKGDEAHRVMVKEVTLDVGLHDALKHIASYKRDSRFEDATDEVSELKRIANEALSKL